MPILLVDDFHFAPPTFRCDGHDMQPDIAVRCVGGHDERHGETDVHYSHRTIGTASTDCLFVPERDLLFGRFRRAAAR